jgi:hypothetical protein
MKNPIHAGLIVLCALSFHTELLAQKEGWKEEKTKDGKVLVVYNFLEKEDEKGKKFNVLEYEARTTGKVNLEDCLAVLEDDSRHKDFMEDTEYTERIRKLSDNEWLSYYRLKKRWPMPVSDVVTRYELERDPDNNRVILIGHPAPDMYPDQGLKRMQESYSKYTLTDLGNGFTEVIMYSRSIPVVSIPKMLLATWIPDGPAKMVNGIIRLAAEEQ